MNLALGFLYIHKTRKNSAKSIADYEASADFSRFRFIDAKKLRISGKYHNESNFNRLSSSDQKYVPAVIKELSKNSAGIAVHFSTNSTAIAIQWELSSDTIIKNNMNRIGVSGVDLYCFRDNKWQFVNSGIPKSRKNQSILISGMKKANRDFILYLPLYDGVKDVRIGVDKGASIRRGKTDSSDSLPVIFYGTSITQGGSASRPGLAYPSIISRDLNREIINFGFSGSGHFDREIGSILCKINASAIVLDCTENSKPETIRKNALNLIEQIRKCRPVVPIVLVESIYRESSYWQTEDTLFGSRAFIQAQNRELRNCFEHAVGEGLNNLYYVKGENLIGTDHEGTVDGTHISDIGQVRKAEAIEQVLKKTLGL